MRMTLGFTHELHVSEAESNPSPLTLINHYRQIDGTIYRRLGCQPMINVTWYIQYMWGDCKYAWCVCNMPCCRVMAVLKLKLIL